MPSTLAPPRSLARAAARPDTSTVTDHDAMPRTEARGREPRPGPDAEGAGAASGAPLVERLLEALGRRIGAEACSRYFEGRASVTLRDGHVRIGVGSGFVAGLVTRRFAGAVREAAAEALGAEGRGTDAAALSVSVEVDDCARSARPVRGASESSGSTDAGARPRRGVAQSGVSARPKRGQRRHRLEDFVVGASNELAYAAAVRLTEASCPGNFARLVIHGGCGVGKTHLLQGVAARFEEAFPGSTVRYVTAEAFTNEFIHSLRHDRLESFRRSLRGVDLLCVDDVHFLSSKQATQEELLHTFDALDLAGARIALASDEHPKRITRLNRALVSRCMSGMIVKLDPPDREMCARLAGAIAGRRGLRLCEEASGLIAGTLCRSTRSRPASVREIEGLVTRVEAVARLVAGQTGELVGVAMVRRALGMDADAAASVRRRSVGVEVIAGEVCAELGVDRSELHGAGRHRRVVLARSLTAYLARRLTNKSFPEIARAMGRPSHSTIVTAARRVEDQIAGGQAVRLADPATGRTFESTVADLAEKLTHAIAQAAARS